MFLCAFNAYPIFLNLQWLFFCRVTIFLTADGRVAALTVMDAGLFRKVDVWF